MALEVTISADEVKALLETGFLLRERRELQKAEEVFEGVVALRPDVEAGTIGLASVYQVQGRDDDATRTLEDAAARFPQSAAVHAQLGEHYHTLERKEDALRALDKALELDALGPWGDAARRLKELVSEGVGYRFGLPDA